MGFVYAGLWIAIAVILLVRFRKESPAVVPMSLYFVFLGGWWAVNEFAPMDLMHDPYVWILRGVSAVMLVFCGVIYYLGRRSEAAKSEQNEDDGEK